MENVREGVVEGHLVHEVKKLRGIAHKLRGRGWPDRLCVLPQSIIEFVETKRPKGGRYEPLQLRTHQKLRRLGHTVHVAHTKAAVDNLVSHWKRMLGVQ